MSISIFDLFSIGIGPSSSHTVGPMRAAFMFTSALQSENYLSKVKSIRVHLYGSLALTGKGHGTDRALLLGLSGKKPESIDPNEINSILENNLKNKSIVLFSNNTIKFTIAENIIFHYSEILPFHPNGMIFEAYNDKEEKVHSISYYSIGGGFIKQEGIDAPENALATNATVEFPFHSAEELLEHCKNHQLKISDVIFRNELSRYTKEEIYAKLDLIWKTMQNCVSRGMQTEGSLPGALKVKRRAHEIFKELTTRPESALKDPLTILDWVNLYAISANEENASGGKVVTSPTNGACGIIPAVMHYYDRFCSPKNDSGIYQFLLTAGAIGILYKVNASISGAEVGCQGEVGVACSMAAAGLTEVFGGTYQQVENAAEIAMEHNLGLTCDPVGGLVQIPCIERNAMGAIKAINASRMALRGNGTHYISLDRVIETMRQTGHDMNNKYKETSQGGLAVNVPEC